MNALIFLTRLHLFSSCHIYISTIGAVCQVGNIIFFILLFSSAIFSAIEKYNLRSKLAPFFNTQSILIVPSLINHPFLILIRRNKNHVVCFLYNPELFSFISKHLHIWSKKIRAGIFFKYLCK